jgi:hypothetical protein
VNPPAVTPVPSGGNTVPPVPPPFPFDAKPLPKN